MVMYEKIRNGVKPCATCTGYVRGKRNSGEVCSRNYRKFQSQDRVALGISVSPFLFAVIMNTITDEVKREPSLLMVL